MEHKIDGTRKEIPKIKKKKQLNKERIVKTKRKKTK